VPARQRLEALPFGLLFGRFITTFIITSLSTETVRLPLVVSDHTYTTAIIVVLTAAGGSFLVVYRMLSKLDLVGVLKARE
jgi:putative ABC transport system permease protein